MITFAYIYYNNPKMLQEHLRVWNDYPDKLKSQIHFILVDDGSRPILHLKRDQVKNLELDIYRINEDLYWNTPGARNLCYLVTDTRVVFLSDMDCIITKETAQAMVDFSSTMSLNTRYFLGKKKRDGTILGKQERSAILIGKTCAIKTGMFDEDFTGQWGGDDSLAEAVGVEQGVPVVYLSETNPLMMVEKWDTEDVEDANNVAGHKAVSSTTGDNFIMYEYKLSKKLPLSNIHLRFSWQHMRGFRYKRGR